MRFQFSSRLIRTAVSLLVALITLPATALAAEIPLGWNKAGIGVDVHIKPHTLNLMSRGGRLTAVVLIPGFPAVDVDASMLTANGVTALRAWQGGDPSTLHVEFDRAAVIATLGKTSPADINVQGWVGHVFVVGFDRVRVVNGDAGGPQLAPSPAGPRNELLDCSPNPFNPVTTITYRIANAGPVRLDVFDVSGRRVRTLVNGIQAASSNGYRVEWNGRDDAGTPVASGVYFYRLTSPGFTATKKMLLVK